MRWRRALPEERQLALLWGFSAAAALLLRDFWLAAAERLPPCVFRSLTGFPCPTCGTTRAATAMLGGDIVAAFAANPLTASAGAAFVVGGLAAPLWVLLRGPVPVLPAPVPVWARLAVVAAFATTWLYLVAAGV